MKPMCKSEKKLQDKINATRRKAEAEERRREMRLQHDKHRLAKQQAAEELQKAEELAALGIKVVPEEEVGESDLHAAATALGIDLSPFDDLDERVPDPLDEHAYQESMLGPFLVEDGVGDEMEL